MSMNNIVEKDKEKEINDTKEFIKLCQSLSPTQKQQVKNIIIGIQIAQETFQDGLVRG